MCSWSSVEVEGGLDQPLEEVYLFLKCCRLSLRPSQTGYLLEVLAWPGVRTYAKQYPGFASVGERIVEEWQNRLCPFVGVGVEFCAPEHQTRRDTTNLGSG